MLLWEEDSKGAWSATRIPPEDALALSPNVSVLSWEDGRGCGVLIRGEADVNGCSSLTFHVLDHRDEIRIDDKLYYLSAASPPEPYPFVPADEPVLCARCGAVPEADAPVVRCPLCEALHDKECFAYDVRCGACREVTSWMPESIGEDDPWRH